MQDILNSDYSEEEKVRLYNQALQKSLFFEKKPLEPIQQPTTESNILKSFDRKKRHLPNKFWKLSKKIKAVIGILNQDLSLMNNRFLEVTLLI